MDSHFDKDELCRRMLTFQNKITKLMKEQTQTVYQMRELYKEMQQRRISEIKFIDDTADMLGKLEKNCIEQEKFAGEQEKCLRKCHAFQLDDAKEIVQEMSSKDCLINEEPEELEFGRKSSQEEPVINDNDIRTSKETASTEMESQAHKEGSLDSTNTNDQSNLSFLDSSAEDDGVQGEPCVTIEELNDREMGIDNNEDVHSLTLSNNHFTGIQESHFQWDCVHPRRCRSELSVINGNQSNRMSVESGIGDDTDLLQNGLSTVDGNNSYRMSTESGIGEDMDGPRSGYSSVSTVDGKQSCRMSIESGIGEDIDCLRSGYSSVSTDDGNQINRISLESSIENNMGHLRTEQSGLSLVDSDASNRPISIESSIEASNRISIESRIDASNRISAESSIETNNRISIESGIEASNRISAESSIEASNRISAESSIEANNRISAESSIEAAMAKRHGILKCIDEVFEQVSETADPFSFKASLERQNISFKTSTPTTLKKEFDTISSSNIEEDKLCSRIKKYRPSGETSDHGQQNVVGSDPKAHVFQVPYRKTDHRTRETEGLSKRFGTLSTSPLLHLAQIKRDITVFEGNRQIIQEPVSNNVD